MDSIIEGFEDNFDELGINTHTDSIMSMSSKISSFVNSIMTSGDYEKFSLGMVIDICQLMPEDFIHHIDQDHCDIYYLITECEKARERLRVL